MVFEINIISEIIEVIISSIALWASLKIVAGGTSFFKAIGFSLVNKIISFGIGFALVTFILPFLGMSAFISYTIISLGLYLIIWFLFLMKFFDLSFLKAIGVVIFIGIVKIILGIILLIILGTGAIVLSLG